MTIIPISDEAPNGMNEWPRSHGIASTWTQNYTTFSLVLPYELRTPVRDLPRAWLPGSHLIGHILLRLVLASREIKLLTEHDRGLSQGPTGLQWVQAPGSLKMTRTGS